MRVYFQEARDSSSSRQGALQQLFFLGSAVLPGGVLPVVFGCDGSVGTAVDGGCQHHEAHNAAHDAGDDHGGDGVAQAHRPHLGLGLAASAAAVTRLAVGAVLQRATVLVAVVVVVAAGQVQSCPQGAGPKELIGNLEQLLPLPDPWC